jgi:CRISPR-associated protein Cas1
VSKKNASTFYFRAYGKILLNDFTFETREYHPPPDPVNAMLGFGYMLVFNELSGLLHAFGFDPYFGLLHELKYGRESLTCDMMEELRSPITDRLIMYLINKDVIRHGKFVLKFRNA